MNEDSISNQKLLDMDQRQATDAEIDADDWIDDLVIPLPPTRSSEWSPSPKLYLDTEGNPVTRPGGSPKERVKPKNPVPIEGTTLSVATTPVTPIVAVFEMLEAATARLGEPIEGLWQQCQDDAEDGNQEALNAIEKLNAAMWIFTRSPHVPDAQSADPARAEEAIDALETWFQIRTKPRMQRPLNPLELPSTLPSYTFPEAREMHRAIGNGRSLKHWAGIDGEFAMRHAIPDETLETKFAPSTRLLEYSQWLTRKSGELTLDLLSNELRRLEFDANLLFSVCLSLVIERGSFSASLDELGKALGWQPKTASDRNEDRLKLWLWLLLFDSLRVIGLRRGIWRDPDDKKKLRDVSSDDDLLHISGTRADMQQRMDNVPFEVSLTAGPWIEKMRGDKSMLFYLGNIRTLAAKPRGRLPARLAVKIGISLLQDWREKATKKTTRLKLVGDKNRPSFQFEPITRKELLTVYGQEAAHEIEMLLKSDDPGRAIKYWDEAIKNLKKWRIVGYCEAIDAKPVTGYNWQKKWYEGQKLDIRPAQVLVPDIARVHASGQQAEKKRAAGLQQAKSTIKT